LNQKPVAVELFALLFPDELTCWKTTSKFFMPSSQKFSVRQAVDLTQK